jgi:hypothetical protein
MVRTQVQFTKEQIEALRAQAAREEVSVSEIVRRAVDAWVRRTAVPSEEELRRRASAAAGRFASGRGDVAAKHDEHLAEAFGQ